MVLLLLLLRLHVHRFNDAMQWKGASRSWREEGIEETRVNAGEMRRGRMRLHCSRRMQCAHSRSDRDPLSAALLPGNIQVDCGVPIKLTAEEGDA